MIDPAEVLANQPVYPKREDSLKSVQDKFPGHVVMASDRASFSGCRILRFGLGAVEGLEVEDEKVFARQCKEAGYYASDGFLKTAEHGTPAAEELANLYFSKRANLLVVNQMADSGELVLFVTTQLDEDDLEEMQEFQTRVQLGMREWREERAKRKEEELAAFREERRLLEVGRSYEANVKKAAPKEPEAS